MIRITLSLGLWLGLAATVPAQAADGKALYEAHCSGCHDSGMAGAPRLGNPAAWQSRLDKGRQRLEANAINGVRGRTGFMPAKGGNPSLSEAQVKAAVAYMVERLD